MSSKARDKFPLRESLSFIFLMIGIAIYANWSFKITNKKDFVYFPPFKPYVNANNNEHLGAEYFNIAKSLVAGEGFSNPFPGKTGPTAWMPPLLPLLLAGFLEAFQGDRFAVMNVIIVIQNVSLILTGILAIWIGWQYAGSFGARSTLLLLILVIICNFHSCFQFTHDSWLVMLTITLLVASHLFLNPLATWKTTTVWGIFGGICALVNPMIALVWGTLTLRIGFQKQWLKRVAICFFFAFLTLTPWTVRNYIVFGRLIPIKSNLSYELYQSQCLQPDGLIQNGTFAKHPYTATGGQERGEYIELGEIAFLEKKHHQFWLAVTKDPLDFFDRVATRFLGATLWYVPYNRVEEPKRVWIYWTCVLFHPFPLLAFLLIFGTAYWIPLNEAECTVTLAYSLYISPYIVVSYYERYAVPLLGVKVMLIILSILRLRILISKHRLSLEGRLG